MFPNDQNHLINTLGTFVPYTEASKALLNHHPPSLGADLQSDSKEQPQPSSLCGHRRKTRPEKGTKKNICPSTFLCTLPLHTLIRGPHGRVSLNYVNRKNKTAFKHYFSSFLCVTR